jgi:hypothetical protein
MCSMSSSLIGDGHLVYIFIDRTLNDNRLYLACVYMNCACAHKYTKLCTMITVLTYAGSIVPVLEGGGDGHQITV